MFEKRSEETELMDDLQLSNDDLRRNLDELETINYWLGGHKVVLQALQKLLTNLQKLNRPITIADVGCGGGDMLREIAKWGKKQGLEMKLTGVDANAFMLHYAAPKCSKFPNINFQQTDIFSPEFQQQKFDVLTCSLFCHHFSDGSLIQLLKQLYNQSGTAVIINDLERHPLAYYSIKALTQVFSKSYLVKNDAPLSVLRAFRKRELEDILQKAGISNYQLKWFWAFRWQLVLLK